jgi:dTMP kinase
MVPGRNLGEIIPEVYVGGKLIVFEGGDGVGKTTQLQRLADWLPRSGLLVPGQSVICTREPGDSQLGQALRQLLLQTDWNQEPLDAMAELLLYAADRAQHVARFLRPQLAQGQIVLCDRYVDSTLAYQGYGRGLAIEPVRQINQIASQGLRADLTLWLDLDPQVCDDRARQRSALDRMEAAGDAFRNQLHQGFQAIAAAEPGRLTRIDATGTADQVAERIQTIVRQRWN